MNYSTYIHKLLNPASNVEEIVTLFCRQFQTKVTQHTLSRMLVTHPFFPSMLAVKDVLEELGFTTEAIRVTDVYQLCRLTCPIFVQVKSENGQELFAVVRSMSEESLSWFNPSNHRWEETSYNDFEKLFTGYALIADADGDVGDKNYHAHRKDELLKQLGEAALLLALPFTTITVLTLRALLDNSGILYQAFYAILLLAGCFCGLLLFLYEAGKVTPALNHVCHFNKYTNCAAILHSSGSRFFGIPWTVLGTGYFLGLLFCLLIGGDNVHMLTSMAFLHFASLPYVAYSLYYQKFVVHQWCPLCLMVQVVIVLLFLCSLFFGYYTHLEHIALSSCVIILFCLLAGCAFLFFLWKLQNATIKGKFLERQLNHIKYQPEVFHALLQQSRKIEHPTDGIGIIVGNPNGSIHIIKVCNPYCGHCAEAQPILQKIAERNHDVKLQVIFTANPHEDYYKETPIDIFLTLYHQGANVETVMLEWYTSEKKDIQAFREKYPFFSHDTEWNRKNAEAMHQFCIDSKITGTPTIFINGHEIPYIYSVKDLLYLV